MNKVSPLSPEPGALSSPQPWAAHRRERTAIRNVTLLLLVRGLIVAGGVASAAVVPRTFGPATYGRYDLITMLTFWYGMLGGLGLGQVLSRQSAELVSTGAESRLQALFGSFFVMRSASGLVAAALYFAITALWLRDLDWTILLVLALVLCLREPGSLCYSLFLGQGRIARWALPDIVRQWGSVAFALPGFLWGGLRGATIGYLVAEAAIFVVGLWGARRTLSWAWLRIDRATVVPLLGLGLAFYGGDLVTSAIERSGSVLVRSLTLDYVEVGLFGVSYQIFTAAVLSTGQITSSFVPLLTVLRTRGEHAEMRVWVERMVKWLTVIAVLGLLGSLTLGKAIVPLVLGRAYGGVFANLVVLAATLLFLPITHTCSLLALVHDQPGVLLKAGLLRLVCFLALGVPLVMRWGSLGACLATGGAVAVQALYLLRRNAGLVGPALRRWLAVVAAGLLVAPLAWLRGRLVVDVGLFVVAVGVWVCILGTAGVISVGELRALRRALGGEVSGASP